MSDDGIQLRVVLDVRKVAIMFNSDKRVSSEGFSGELVVAVRNCRSLERCDIVLEKPLDDVDDGTLASSTWAIENQKLLDRLRITRDDGPNCPFDLRSIFRRIQRRHKLIPSLNLAFLKVVREAP